MRKKIIMILFTLVIFTTVGCGKSNENNIAQQVNDKYMYFELEKNSWGNNKYGYTMNETYIAYFNEDNVSLYSMREKVEESMSFKGSEVDEDKNGITYNFISHPEDEFKLHMYLDKENNNELKVELSNPQGSIDVVNSELMTKEECEDKIKETIHEIELENMIKIGFDKETTLDLEKIKSDIDKAKEKLYEETKTSKDDTHYLYSPGGTYGDLENESKDQYIAFYLVDLDEYGEMLTISDFVYLVNKDDYTIYTFSPGVNGNGVLEKYEYKSPEPSVSNNQTNNSNENTTNNNTESSASNKPSQTEQEQDMARIMAKYGPSTEEHQVDVSGDPIFYNGEWCYMVATHFETPTGMGKSNQFHVGSKTLQNYGFIAE